MKKVWKVFLLLELGVFVSALAGAQAQSSGDQEKSLGDIARELRANKKTQNPCPPAKPCVEFWSPSQIPPGQSEEGEQKYRFEIWGLINRHAFAELDQAADSARSSKERFAGGTWKLYEFYDELATPPYIGSATERDWPGRLARLQNWVAAYPESISARVALADCYHRYAWAGRGTGYADTVTDDAWKVFHARAAQALTILEEAAKLPAKCPHWYFVMLDVTADLGSKDGMRAIFERAVSFEPTYYHYFREYAYFLLPKWYGEPGEAQALAEESYQRIGGRQGALVYFEIATVIYCGCNDTSPPPTLSWPRLQEGFAVVEEQYGATMLKLNRFAYLAYLYHDKEVANRILARVGNKWDSLVWPKREAFDLARAWAGLTNP